MKNSYSLKAKLLFLLVVMSTLAMSMFAFMAHQRITGIEHSKLGLVKTLSSSYIDKIDRNLFERYGDVQAFALSESAQSGNAERIRNFMNDMMGTYAPVYDVMIVVNLDGKVIAANTVDKAGSPLDTSSLFNKDYSNQEWFKRAVTGKIEPATSYVESLHFDPDIAEIIKNDGAVMSFTAPIRSKSSGKVIGVWTNRMSWKDVILSITKEELTAIKDLGLPEVNAFITDSKGVFLVHPDSKSILKQTYTNFDNAYEMIKKGPQSFLSDPELDKQSDHEFFQGISYSKGYSVYPGVGWMAGLEVTTEDPAVTWSWIWTALGFAFLGISTLFGWRLLTQTSNALISFMNHLSTESNDVKTIGGRIADGSESLASMSTEQAAALQETAASIEEMNAMIKKSAEGTDQSRKVSSNSHTAASRGKNAVENMISSINEINSSIEKISSQVEESNTQITDVVKVINEIGNKTKIINDIVFQTKLLSFNASVEAARAGEHGKGFAVVAEEIGHLAQMSGTAAKEISDLLTDSTRKVEETVETTKSKVSHLIDEGKSKVSSGTKVANECGEILDEVVRNVAMVDEMINQISSATREQAQGVGEITKAVNQLDKATHQNASTAQNAASDAQNLSKKSDSLLSIVKKLGNLVQGSSLSHAAEMEKFVKTPRSFVPEMKPITKSEAPGRPLDWNQKNAQKKIS